MKNLNSILTGVLFLAVIALFVLQFSSPKAAKVEANEVTAIATDSGNFAVAYVDFDSILLNYDMFINLQDDLMKKQGSKEAELNSKAASLEKRAADYQGKMQKGLITRANAAQIEQQLYADQQNLLMLREQMAAELAEEAQVMERQVRYAIVEYMKVYNEDKGYQFILGRSYGSNVMYADERFDITTEIVTGLNEKYNSEAE